MDGRVYDPRIGRFMSADLLVQSPYSTQSYNRYSYVSNNPMSNVDPTGYCGNPYSQGYDGNGNLMPTYDTPCDDGDHFDLNDNPWYHNNTDSNNYNGGNGDSQTTLIEVNQNPISQNNNMSDQVAGGLRNIVEVAFEFTGVPDAFNLSLNAYMK